MNFAQLWAAAVETRWSAVAACRCPACTHFTVEQRDEEGHFMLWPSRNAEIWLGPEPLSEQDLWLRPRAWLRSGVYPTWQYAAAH